MADKGYAGKIKNQGSQVVPAPAQSGGKKHGVVKTSKTDLRGGSGKKD